ncbi:MULTISPECIES: hypothetical protein [Burkholderia]|uniref:hypothetical protein n=1 Tax=Burkholderia TaxID=32008 RepID=UPI000A4FA288|nr:MULTISPECIES: hypothetical protein [Burkholderia]
MDAEFGHNLMPAVSGVNDKRFFEDLNVYAIDQEILALAGADWHSLALIEFEGSTKRAFGRFASGRANFSRLSARTRFSR